MSQATTNSTISAAGVQLVASTWARESHDLFDFESQEVTSETFTINQTAICVRSGGAVAVQTGPAAALSGGPLPPASWPAAADGLLRVVERVGHFWVDRVFSSKRLWSVVKDVAPSGYKLTEGDLIKLGRFKFRVRQLVTTEDTAQPDLSVDSSKATCLYDPEEDLSSKPCRICLMEGPGEDDPLIKPCKCKGSIEYVHLQCLRYWMKSRLNLAEAPTSGSYFYRALPCELCLETFPARVGAVDGEQAPLMEVPRVPPPFVVLENVVRDSRRHSRGLHVVSLAEKPCMLGRGHESDVRIADVSISRCHASIGFKDGHFSLQDNGSKFGTLVALHRPQVIGASRPVSLQIGRTVLSLSLLPAAGVDAGVGAGNPNAVCELAPHAAGP